MLCSLAVLWTPRNVSSSPAGGQVAHDVAPRTRERLPPPPPCLGPMSHSGWRSSRPFFPVFLSIPTFASRAGGLFFLFPLVCFRCAIPLPKTHFVYTVFFAFSPTLRCNAKVTTLDPFPKCGEYSRFPTPVVSLAHVLKFSSPFPLRPF